MLLDSNKTEAVRLLNEVRKSRGLEDVDSAKVATREAFNKEMLRERMREMPGEGQTFYALKHYNKAFTDFRGITTHRTFVLLQASHAYAHATSPY